ncbi:MAG: thioredoxin family protein [Anaerolineae bacterium]|nr:thioredoxin family protein [Anaerolineae bacterium]
MPLLSNKDATFLRDHFRETLVKPVRLINFTQTIACQFCRETGQILEEVAALSDLISVETYNFVTDREIADQFGVDKIPATVIMSDRDYGIRFYGIPSGYEFTSLVEDIVDVSRGATELSEETRQKLEQIQDPLHIQVFVTPTCPYCPAAVRMAHSLAIASDKIRADMVEAIEFPHLANKYGVYGVPRNIINEDTQVEGALPEPLFLANVLQAAGLMPQEEVDQLMEKMAAEVEVAHEHEHGEDEGPTH